MRREESSMSGGSGTIATIPESEDYALDGATLTEFHPLQQFAVLPEGIEAVSDNVLEKWRTRADIRRRVIFPSSLRRLTWQQLLNIGDAQIDLPDGFLGSDGRDSIKTASQPLRDGWMDDQITLGGAVRAYLLKKPREAALAESLISTEYAARAAEHITHILRARAARNKKIPASVLLRAVVFFIRFVREIPARTVSALVRFLPGGKLLAMREPPSMLEGVAPYHPVLLDYVLCAVKIDPNHRAFRGRLAWNKGVKIHVGPLAVKSAVVPYIAAGLDVAIHDQASRWLPWTQYDYTADAYAETIIDIEEVVQAIVPGLRHTPVEQTFDCAVLVGRFGTDDAIDWMEDLLESMDISTKKAMQILSGLVLTPRMPYLAGVDDDTRYMFLHRYIELSIRTRSARLLLYTRGYEVGERQATRTLPISSRTKWDVVVGPDLQVRWRPTGTSKLLPTSDLKKTQFIPPEKNGMGSDEAKNLIARHEFYLTLLKKHITMKLNALYFSGAHLPANTVQHMGEDSTLTQAVCGVVWEQDGVFFTFTTNGAVDANGEAVTLSDGNVRIAYAPKMDPQDVAAWRGYFRKQKYDSWMGHMEEPDYSTQTLARDRYSGMTIKHSDFKWKKMMPVILQQQGRIYVGTKKISLHFYPTSGIVVCSDLEVHEMDRTVNRILFQLDMATADERVHRDDPTILPYLERAPLTVLRKARKTSMLSGSLQVKAAVMTMLDEADDKLARNRFSLSH